MRHKLTALSAALIATTACAEASSAPKEVPTFHLTATVTENNHCTVTVLGKTYSSIGQVRGDVPSQFIGTVAEKSYHGFGCWVQTGDGDGDLVVLFSGNNLGKPLEPGTYPLALEIFDNTPLHTAALNFRPSDLGGDKLRAKDNAAGAVTVEATPSGGRKITADVEVVRWGPVL